jgi:hypothetical protein
MTPKLQGLRELTDAELDQVHGGAMHDVTTHENGGGNTPKGQANGVPTVTVTLNPQDKPPPGQN